MSIRAKFSIILALLGLTLSANVVLSVWSIRFLQRELAWPLESMQPVLSALHHVKRLGEESADTLGVGRLSVTGLDPEIPAQSGRTDVERVIEFEREALDEIERLESLPTALVRSGVSTTQNLRERSARILALAIALDESDDDATRGELIARLEARHELIERIEGRILQDAQLATDYGDRLRIVIYTIIIVSTLGVILSAFVAAVLVRRWILEPVGILKHGARRFAEGAFDHRIRVRSRDELGELSDEFNEMARTITVMQDDRIERERLAAMGEMAQRTVHNLRTPLAGIRALAETTRHELSEGSELIDMQDRIIESVDRFETWLQGMLRVSSPIELELVTCDPARIARRVIEAHQPVASKRGVSLTLDLDGAPSAVVGDPTHLEHAMTALVSNAIDFTGPDHGVRVSIGSDYDGFWALTVEDEGSGIDPDVQGSIFRPYFTTRKSGTGIGLAMVKRIIDQHGGEIGVISPCDPDSGLGTRFMCRIPIEPTGRG